MLGVTGPTIPNEYCVQRTGQRDLGTGYCLLWNKKRVLNVVYRVLEQDIGYSVLANG